MVILDTILVGNVDPGFFSPFPGVLNSGVYHNYGKLVASSQGSRFLKNIRNRSNDFALRPQTACRDSTSKNGPIRILRKNPATGKFYVVKKNTDHCHLESGTNEFGKVTHFILCRSFFFSRLN